MRRVDKGQGVDFERRGGTSGRFVINEATPSSPGTKLPTHYHWRRVLCG